MAINVSHMVQEIAMELLSNAGFSVSLADDGDVAVETLRTAAPDQFDLVLMDITMPNMDGLEALKAIRSKDSNANVVMCSAMGQEAMVMEAVQAGIKDFIVKPFKDDRLMKTVNSILGAP